MSGAEATGPLHIEPLTREHDRNGFDCGEPTLNAYLQRLALQHAERNISRTFIALQGESVEILGFYTLATAESVSRPYRPIRNFRPTFRFRRCFWGG